MTGAVSEVGRGLGLCATSQLRQTLAWDQGAEMAEHATFAVATDMKVFFCDPASLWQRGSNENTNGLLRGGFNRSSQHFGE